jgi:hypothetical protein
VADIPSDNGRLASLIRLQGLAEPLSIGFRGMPHTPTKPSLPVPVCPRRRRCQVSKQHPVFGFVISEKRGPVLQIARFITLIAWGQGRMRELNVRGRWRFLGGDRPKPPHGKHATALSRPTPTRHVCTAHVSPMHGPAVHRSRLPALDLNSGR